MWKNLRRPDLKGEAYIRISWKEKIFLYVKSILAMILIDYCFYRSFIAMIPLSAVGFVFFKMEQKELIHKKKEETRQQFKEMLLLTVTGQKAGYSVENAFLNSYQDMVNLYGNGSSICLMLTKLKAGLGYNLKAADLWKKMGNACDIEEIKEFSEVFSIAKESGGNMAVIMERTAQIIENKAETQKEIETFLSARKLEQKIMNMMPFMLMFYISFTSPGYFDGLYHSTQGAAVMTFCLLIYLSAYLAGAKIAAIEV